MFKGLTPNSEPAQPRGTTMERTWWGEADCDASLGVFVVVVVVVAVVVVVVLVNTVVFGNGAFLRN